ncbi:Uncharacterised protein [Yersinia enterocolitica]|nr:Uncharacterised protein [Yersinia enterocolitica]
MARMGENMWVALLVVTAVAAEIQRLPVFYVGMPKSLQEIKRFLPIDTEQQVVIGQMMLKFMHLCFRLRAFSF